MEGLRQEEGVVASKNEAREVKSLQKLISACQTRPHLVTRVLKMLPVWQQQDLAAGIPPGILERVQSPLCQDGNMEVNQLDHLRDLWFHGTPELQTSKVDFRVDLMGADDDVHFLTWRLMKYNFDRYGAAMAMKTRGGHIIVLTNKDLTHMNTIHFEPNPWEYFPFLLNSKYVLVGGYGSAKVFSRQNVKKLYDFTGLIGFYIHNDMYDEILCGVYSGDSINIAKVDEKSFALVTTVPYCCDIYSFRCNIIPSSSGEQILGVCTACWKIRKFSHKAKEVIWELQVVPRIKNGRLERTWLVLLSGILVLYSQAKQVRESEAIFIDPDQGKVIPIEHDKNGLHFMQCCSKHFIVLSWQIRGYRKFRVYDRRSGETRKLQVLIYKQDQYTYLKIIGENILVVTSAPPPKEQRVRILIVDLNAQDLFATMRIMSTSYGFVRAMDEGLVVLTRSRSATLAITRQDFKMSTYEDTK